MSIRTTVKSIQDIMRQDVGVGSSCKAVYLNKVTHDACLFLVATTWWIPSSTEKGRTFHQTLCGIQP
jgi:hypothetical protein